MSASSPLTESILKGITKARAHVYKVGSVTPLQKIEVPKIPVPVWIKREDLGPIKAYKWRGSFNAISQLSADDRAHGVVAASAGNHAQGVALACQYLQCPAEIFMPTATPLVKQNEVARIGGEWVKVHLVGDNYDEASAVAQENAKERGMSYIHPYDADEIVMSGEGPFSRVYVAIGGGGLVSAVAIWLKFFYPEVEIIGVEGNDQASMKKAIDHGAPTPLDYLDVFCDGTAVRTVGENTYQICRGYLDRIVTVSNGEVCQAVRTYWENLRVVPEPSGAMGLAAMIKDQESYPFGPDEKPLTILCGANMDFAQIGKISAQANYYRLDNVCCRIPVPDKKGALVELLNQLPEGVNIGDMQYGYDQIGTQYPVITLVVSELENDTVVNALKERFEGIELLDENTIGEYRMIEFSKDLLKRPEFLEVEFPERAGALKEFMEEMSLYVNLFYFNYQYSGERVGRALVGVDYENSENQEAAQRIIEKLTPKIVRKIHKVKSSE